MEVMLREGKADMVNQSEISMGCRGVVMTALQLSSKSFRTSSRSRFFRRKNMITLCELMGIDEKKCSTRGLF